MNKLDEIIRSRQAPGFLRPVTGPGSCENEIVGTRPDVPKEIMLTLKRAEELGKMRDPKFRRNAEGLAASIKAKAPLPKVDYEKDGHPSLGDLND
jgi:hypothetical protein